MYASRKRKAEIETDLERNDPRYKLISPVSKKSSIWTNFQQVEFNGQLENFARCIKCKELLSCSSKTGTGSLLRHKCSTEGNKGSKTNLVPHSPAMRIQKLPTQQIHFPRFEHRKWLECSKKDLTKQQINFIAKELRPLNIIEGEEFQKFCQTLISIGSKYGYQNIKEILTSKENLEKNVIPVEYERIKNELEINICNNPLAFSTDTWTEEYTNRSFLTVTVHYFKEDFNFKTNVLGTCELTSDTNIHDSVVEIISKFNVEEKLRTGVIVTSNNREVKAAFQNYKHLSCACHNLNLSIDEALDKSYIPELKILIDDSKKLVQFFTNSELNNQLTNPLKRTNEMTNLHWNSIYIILTTILDDYMEIQRLLVTINEVEKIIRINPNLLQELLDFLGPFKECSEQFSADTTPTIHQYVLWFEKLMKHSTKNAGDSETIAELKVCTSNALKKFLQPSPLHNVAIFLNPPYKKLKFMTDDKRAHTMATIKAILEEQLQPKTKSSDMKKEMTNVKFVNSRGQTSQSSSTSDCSACSTSADVDLFDEFKDEYDDDDSNTSIKEIDDELEAYLKKKVNQCNILDFWRDATDLPLLRSLSKHILNIPVSAANEERIFSTPARILAERRNQLLSENVDEILFLNKNL